MATIIIITKDKTQEKIVTTMNGAYSPSGAFYNIMKRVLYNLIDEADRNVIKANERAYVTKAMRTLTAEVQRDIDGQNVLQESQIGDYNLGIFN